jgi:hypothetical protein
MRHLINGSLPNEPDKFGENHFSFPGEILLPFLRPPLIGRLIHQPYQGFDTAFSHQIPPTLYYSMVFTLEKS